MWTHEPVERGERVEARRTTGNHDVAGMALLRLAYGCVAHGEHAVARWYLHEAIEDAHRADVDVTVPYALYLLARLDLDEGQWDDALEGARLLALADHSCAVLPRTSGLVVTGLVRARRGDAGVWASLDEAWELVAPTGDVGHIEVVAAARAEAAWLEGRMDATRAAVGAAAELGVRPWARLLLYWCWRAGGSAVAMPDPADPRTLAMAGDWRAAAEAWDAVGFPYEAAMARLDADDDDALLCALDALQRLGARPLCDLVAGRLRRHGVTQLRRRASVPARAVNGTVACSADGLSGREYDVLELVAEGCSNREIARRLFISPHTAANHVRAILRKTETGNRTEAAAIFHANGDRPVRRNRLAAAGPYGLP